VSPIGLVQLWVGDEVPNRTTGTYEEGSDAGTAFPSRHGKRRTARSSRTGSTAAPYAEAGTTPVAAARWASRPRKSISSRSREPRGLTVRLQGIPYSTPPFHILIPVLDMIEPFTIMRIPTMTMAYPYNVVLIIATRPPAIEPPTKSITIP